MEKKLKAAVVGVGYLGRFHAQKLKAHTQVDLIGVCDFYFPQAQKVAEELSVTAFEAYDELLGKVDFVHIAASTQAHYEIAEFFIRHQIPVLVEKPIAATAAQAEKLCLLAEQNKTLLTVGHIERFNPAFQLLKQQIQHLNLDSNLPYYLELNRLAPFRIRGSDVSVLHDLTIHDMDLVNWLFNSEIESFQIFGQKLIQPTYDDVSIRLKLKNSVQVTINNSRVCPQIIRNFRWVTQDSTLFVNTATLDSELLITGDKYKKRIANDPLQVSQMQNINQTLAFSDEFHGIEKKQIVKQDALALEVDHFVQALLGYKPLAITAIEATQALKSIENFIQQLDIQNNAK